MNKVILIGNLTREPELSQTSNGIPYCRMSIAVNRPYTGSDGERQADFFNIVTWRKVAENCHKYLKKGSKIAVNGFIQIRTYEQDGVKKYATDIVAEDVEFLSKAETDNTKNVKSEKTPLEKLQEEDLSDLPF